MMPAPKTLLVMMLSATLAGCATEVRQAPSSLPIPAAWRNQVGPGAAVEASWWRAFNDPSLNQLVDQALRNNPDILTARSRVDQYRAQLRGAQGDNFPTLDAGVSAARALPVSRHRATGRVGGFPGAAAGQLQR